MRILDIVDQFDPNPPKPETSSKPLYTSLDPSTSDSTPVSTNVGPGQPSKEKAPQQQEVDEIPEDLAKQLAESMESFMRELAGSQAAPAASEEEKKLREEWEKMLIEGMNGLDVEDSTTSSKPNSTSGPNAGPGEDEFQKSIRAAMEKLKNSDSALNVCSCIFLPHKCIAERSSPR